MNHLFMIVAQVDPCQSILFWQGSCILILGALIGIALFVTAFAIVVRSIEVEEDKEIDDRTEYISIVHRHPH